MGKSNYNDSSDNNEKNELGSWIGIMIMMAVFWPVGLFMLLRKLRIFSNPDKVSNKRSEKRSKYKTYGNKKHYDELVQTVISSARELERTARDAARDMQSASGDSVKEAEVVAREIASELAQAARDVGNAAGQIFRSRQSVVTQDNARSSKRDSFQSMSIKQEEDFSANSNQKKASFTGNSAAESISYRLLTDDRRSEQQERSALDKKSGKLVSVILLLISVALFILGANSIFGAVRDIFLNGFDRRFDLYLGIFYTVGGFLSFISRNTVAKRLARYKRYITLISGHDVVSLAEISKTFGLSVRTVKRDIQAMIDAGYLEPGAYLDYDLGYLVLSHVAAENVRNSAVVPVIPKTEVPTDESSENRYIAILHELRDLNITIIDDDISDKIDRIEEVTAMIFRIVEENPEKLPQIRRFMNYYLPTTMKLLRSYATLEKQGIKGENITAAKENISRVLEMLATGFEQQFDQLFKADALEIAADISVLENLMQQDGLTDGDAVLKVLEV